ncbi:MAG: helix-turn-helix domain-containing protein [Verrucomicrobiales bacterium]|nr:helix-turn-helix domain-containing protein [Verrucomicrobiales bacterium]
MKSMVSPLETRLAAFLRAKRGKLTYLEFAHKLHVTASSVFRIENCQQSVTLRSLERILKRLDCTVDDVFQ